jgi:putative restriction endonuclease
MCINKEERDQKAWKKLVEVAKNKEKCTYKDLGDYIGIHHRTVRFPLESIQSYCKDNNLPPLSILVVSIAGKLGSGFNAVSIDQIDNKTKEVQDYNWELIGNPFDLINEGYTDKKIISEVLEQKKLPDEVLRSCIDRGRDQELFRKILFEAYSNKCCVCGIEIPEILEAAHIIPYRECNDEQKFSVNNGLLLCANHHKLFDNGLLEITKEYKIFIKNINLDILINRQNVGIYNGRMINLPTKLEHYPNKNLLDSMSVC